MTYFVLIASIISLFFGAFFASRFSTSHLAYRWLNRLVVVIICMMVIFHILPESISVGGLSSWLFLIMGLFIPIIFEKALFISTGKVHTMVLILAIFGLGIHALLDGNALIVGNHSDQSVDYLSLAIVLHRLLDGLVVWVLLSQILRTPQIMVVLMLMSLLTIMGYFTATYWLESVVDHAVFAWFQSLMSGILLHVLFHCPGVMGENSKLPSSG
ncbi:MAG: hypothetical protein HON94_08260 [Methylococcales bacterium]|nr:hypothetical protein [Methylococcales bacterium]MBT7409037.1 hypothetical protein [Methylococcales bacterium]